MTSMTSAPRGSRSPTVAVPCQPLPAQNRARQQAAWNHLRRGLLAALIGAQALLGAGTAVWDMSTYKDFIGGVFHNVSLSREGRLTVGPELKTVFASEQPLLWALAPAPDGTVYLGTGHRGRVFRVARDGASKLLWEAPEPEVFALVVAPDGTLYAGTSPDGKVYHLNASGQATEFFKPETKYIWSLAFGRDGSLYVGTGDRGKIFRVDTAGKGELYYDTKQSHVTTLALDRQGALLAGTDPSAILYRVTAKDKAFVLYDAPLAEIRALQVAPDGAIYVAAMGGSAARATQPATTTVGDSIVPPLIQSITVVATGDAAQQQLPKPEPPKPAVPATPPAATAAQPASATPATPGTQRSALFRIAPDDTVETLWTSNEANIYALLPQKAGLLFSTDDKGRIYRLDAARQVTLVAQTGEEETARLADVGDAVLAATSSLGKLYRLGEAPAAVGTYESQARDTGTISRWGKLSWKAQTPSGTALEFSTRAGNSSKPDATWSDWSPPLRNPDGSAIASPTARFIQWRAELRGARDAAPVIESVSLAYLPQNAAPVVKSILVTSTQTATSRAATGAAPPPASGPADFTVTVTDTGTASTSTNPGTISTVLSRGSTQSQVTSISWQAEDPDGDKLIAKVFFRGEGENAWKLIKENVTDSYLNLDADALADGVYQVKVSVSDSPANPPATAREAELISDPFLIDNTPPVVRVTGVERTGNRAIARFQAQDAASMLQRAEYSVNAGPWVPVYPDDGILDSKSETFTITLENLAAGEHLVTLRVADRAGNPGLGKAVVR